MVMDKKGYRVVLQHKTSGIFKDVSVITTSTEEAIRLARENINDTENEYVLFDLVVKDVGVISCRSYS
jgi:hypothetical protein